MLKHTRGQLTIESRISLVARFCQYLSTREVYIVWQDMPADEYSPRKNGSNFLPQKKLIVKPTSMLALGRVTPSLSLIGHPLVPAGKHVES